MKIIIANSFQRAFKPLFKKYPSLKSELARLIEDLSENPEMGIHIGKNCYKIRLAIKSKARGKSGGGRVITYVLRAEEMIYLISIYDKSDKESLDDQELDELLAAIGLNDD